MTQPNFEVLFGVRNIIINFGIGICDSFEVACLRRCSEEELESYRFSIKNVLSAEDILSLIHIFKHQQICLKNNIWWDLRLRRIWNITKNWAIKMSNSWIISGRFDIYKTFFAERKHCKYKSFPKIHVGKF